MVVSPNNKYQVTYIQAHMYIDLYIYIHVFICVTIVQLSIGYVKHYPMGYHQPCCSGRPTNFDSNPALNVGQHLLSQDGLADLGGKHFHEFHRKCLAKNFRSQKKTPVWDTLKILYCWDMFWYQERERERGRGRERERERESGGEKESQDHLNSS